MRLIEFVLNETTEEDRAIISLADVVARHIRKYTDYFDPKSTEPLDIGKIGDFATPPLDGIEDISIELQSPESMGRRIAELSDLPYTGKRYNGVWISTGPTIVISSDRITSDKLESTLTHELRHALDDLKSAGKANSSTRYRRPKKKEFRIVNPTADDDSSDNDHKKAYLAEPAEINGRFLQVQRGLIDSILMNYKQPPEQLRQTALKALKRLLIKYRISMLFPEKTKSKDYRRLVKRAVDMIDKEIKYVSGLD